MTRARSPDAAASPTVGPAIVLCVLLAAVPMVSAGSGEVPEALRFFNNALFLAVIGVLGLGIWWLRRRLQPGSARGSGARVVPVAMIGTRERIAVVEFEGRRMLVGVTPHQISLLCELDRDGFSEAHGPGGTRPVSNPQASDYVPSTEPLQNDKSGQGVQRSGSPQPRSGSTLL